MKKAILLLVLFILMSCGKKEEPTPATAPLTTKLKSSTTYSSRFDSKVQKFSEKKLWALYKTARADAKERAKAGDLSQAIDALLLAGEVAIKLNRPDIAAWQFNNAAKQAIDLFKQLTEYEKNTAQLEDMRRGDAKAACLKETQELFKKDINLLYSAKSYLKEAQKYDGKVERSDEKRKERKEREETIANNQSFIEETLAFIGDEK